MGISHPLSDEYDALRGAAAVLSPERTPPSSPLAHHSRQLLVEHEVTRMDTLAGIAIKYGVEISDIKRANGLVTDSQMFAHKTLLIPLPGMPMPSSVGNLNGSGQRTKRARAPNHQQNRDALDSLDSSKSGQQGASPAMSTLQRYYGLAPQKGNTMDRSTEMSSYHKGSSFQSYLSETLLNPSAAPGTKGTDISWNLEASADNGFSATSAASGTKTASKAKQDGSVRRRQKVEAEVNTTDTQDDFRADPIKVIKNLLPRPISSIRVNMDTGSTDSSQNQKSSISFLNGFKSVTVRKSPSAPSFADAENGVSMWSSSKWTFNHDSFTRPLLDGLPKQVSVRRTKTALD